MTHENIGGADGGRTHDLRIAKPDRRDGQVLVIPLVMAQHLLLRRADECVEVLSEGEKVPSIPCVQLSPTWPKRARLRTPSEVHYVSSTAAIPRRPARCLLVRRGRKPARRSYAQTRGSDRSVSGEVRR